MVRPIPIRILRYIHQELGKRGSISYDHFHPEPAAAGLQFAVRKLRDKVHALTLERVLVRKAFLEERLAAVEQDRTAAQDALIAFQREFGVVNLNAQSESALQHLTSLKTDLYRKEVELHSQIELLGENTAAVVRLRSAVDQLRTLTLEIEHGFVEFQETHSHDVSRSHPPGRA